MLLLVGDNPFHGISHLSQARARSRDHRLFHSDYAAGLVALAMNNGADGFMFSVSDPTLSIIRKLPQHMQGKDFTLVAITPYAYEYVRKATVLGHVGLAKKVAGDIIGSLNVSAVTHAAKAYLALDLVEGIKALIDYELSRIMRVSKGKFRLHSLMLHEVIVDTLTAYGLAHLLAEALEYVAKKGVLPGVETRNMPSVYKTLREFSSVFEKTIYATPFNKLGFQMAPSREIYEEMVREAPEKVIAMSAFAGGYLNTEDALEYLAKFRDCLLGAVFGVSKEKHAVQNFTLARKILG